MVVTIKKTSWGGSNKFEDIAKTSPSPKLSGFRIVGSSLFHSMITDGKKVFLKKLCLILISGISSMFLEDVFSGITLERLKGLLFL